VITRAVIQDEVQFISLYPTTLSAFDALQRVDFLESRDFREGIPVRHHVRRVAALPDETLPPVEDDWGGEGSEQVDSDAGKAKTDAKKDGERERRVAGDPPCTRTRTGSPKTIATTIPAPTRMNERAKNWANAVVRNSRRSGSTATSFCIWKFAAELCAGPQSVLTATGAPNFDGSIVSRGPAASR
jgi:hypothetical protein